MIEDRDAWLALHLERVSRSFAYCIARLEVPLRQQVGLAYLICRLLDSIEDSDWSAGSPAMGANLLQQQAFDDFIRFLKSPPSAKEVMQWSDGMLASAKMPAGETALVKDAHFVFLEFWQQNQRVRDVMTGPIESMALGMKEFRGRSLRGLLDVNR
jgi:farnesyl-diphosphate farnesyltransferase